MVSFHADHHFVIGRSHLNGGKPCQDYAASGSLDNAAFAIVSDGCSTGGHTDVGSRVLALATAQALRRQWMATGEMQLTVIAQLQRMVLDTACPLLGVTRQDLLATCVQAFLSPHGGFVHLQGDGVVAWQTQDGVITMIRFDWEGNAPAYPVYAADNYAEFVRHHGGDLSAQRFGWQHCQFIPGKGLTEAQPGTMSLVDAMRGCTAISFTAEHVAELKFLAVFTDGVTQFKDRDWREVVLKLLAFKLTGGQFVVRRLNFEVKESEKAGTYPMDDVGMAVIHVSTPVKEGET